jgi:quercetin 2,3-dioxygenase
MAKYTIFPASTRGTTNYGWLHTRHSFSFGDYYDPKRLHFGALRVLNDDMLAPSKGFGMHPHSNMEIITLPLEGRIEHKDNMGNAGTIGANEVQIMSAGTGVFHSEYNASKTDTLKLLQIWIVPQLPNVQPRYAQGSYTLAPNAITNIVLPPHTESELWIHQQAWISMGFFDKGQKTDYQFNKKEDQCLFLFVIKGSILVDGQALELRDAIGITHANTVNIECQSDAQFLLIEAPVL